MYNTNASDLKSETNNAKKISNRTHTLNKGEQYNDKISNNLH